MNKELVLAVYDKNATWLKDVNDDVIVTKYSKNPSKSSDDCIQLENIGREIHTFFHHIVNRYESLSDYTFFSQEEPFDHVSNMVEIINGGVETWNVNAKQHFDGCWFFCTQYDVITCDKRGKPNHDGLDMVKWWEILIDEPFPSDERITFTPTSHFVISKETVLHRPLAYYSKILELMRTDKNTPWLLERLICYIFNNKIKIKE